MSEDFEQLIRCPKCGRFVRAKDPRRALAGNPERRYHSHAGSNHNGGIEV